MINHFLVRLYFVLLSSEPYLLTLAKTDYPSILHLMTYLVIFIINAFILYIFSYLNLQILLFIYNTPLEVSY